VKDTIAETVEQTKTEGASEGARLQALTTGATNATTTPEIVTTTENDDTSLADKVVRESKCS